MRFLAWGLWIVVMGSMSIMLRTSSPEGLVPISASQSIRSDPAWLMSEGGNLSDLQRLLQTRWIVSAPEAQVLIDQGAVVLDARESHFPLKRLKGAIAVRWQHFSSTHPITRGLLLESDAELTQKIQALGISADRPVVVIGDPIQGWGEEGRMVWMLRTLGHPAAVWVDGGQSALAVLSPSTRIQKRLTVNAGTFEVQRRATWTIERDALLHQLHHPALMVVDTREPREYAGETPYGETRGGHIPGAIPLYFKSLLGRDGKLLPKSALIAKLQKAGISPHSSIVVYCTGGVRSGWMATVLVSLGYRVKNYAGSMWDWSAASEKIYPLDLKKQ